MLSLRFFTIGFSKQQTESIVLKPNKYVIQKEIARLHVGLAQAKPYAKKGLAHVLQVEANQVMKPMNSELKKATFFQINEKPTSKGFDIQAAAKKVLADLQAEMTKGQGAVKKGLAVFQGTAKKVMADVQAGAKQEEADLKAEANREQQAVMKK
eukprot:TRINITY_DN329_c0_g1_i1.p1 TRINITY_DN329_c0_g1~~TRINITY_DN329_c0_g1_i1.p1  ORF type:complete len:154 (-),score=39.98 TRINITY_DN329_c0_g1_i1:24-485(-)